MGTRRSTLAHDMDAPQFHRARVRATHAVSGDLVELVLDVDAAEVLEGHTRPGQFLEARLPGLGSAPFAIASAPSPEDTALELLVKRGSPLADALADAGRGTELEVSAPRGRGFDVDGFRGRDVLLFATGSGISGIRPVVHHLVRHRDRFGRVVLFFGARTPDGFAYLDELPTWERRAIEVVRVVSRPGAGTRWPGPTGHVQDALDALAPDLDEAVALLCGHPGMVRDVAAVLRSRGVPPDRVLTNT